MALSNGFKQAMKFRTLRSRRMEVVSFGATVVIGIVTASLSLWYSLPLCLYAFRNLGEWSFWSWGFRRRVIPVSTLDDRAMLDYGKLFESLSQTQQGAVLKVYRGGTRLLNYFPDEREKDLRAVANAKAFVLLRGMLPVLLAFCWAVKYWDPRAHVLMMIFWVVVAVLGLPQMVLLWTEPEDFREMHVAKREA